MPRTGNLSIHGALEISIVRFLRFTNSLQLVLAGKTRQFGWLLGMQSARKYLGVSTKHPQWEVEDLGPVSFDQCLEQGLVTMYNVYAILMGNTLMQ